MKTIASISIIGSGNVAQHLGKALVGHVKVLSVYSPNFDHCQSLAEDLFAFPAERLEDLLPADLILVCISDDHIASVIEQLSEHPCVAYTSGAIEMDSIPRSKGLGVLYPLQSFNKDRTIELEQVPFFIEADNEVFAQALYDLTKTLSNKVVYANSEDRKHLHLAAVMVNNFNNHLVYLAQEFLKDKKMEWEYLLPLIQETTAKLQNKNPFDAQTGPARRGDQQTIAAHLAMLDGPTKEIYQLLSQNILKTYQNDD